MSLTAFFLILFSAGFHASWNLLAKKGHMSFPFYAMLCSVSALCWLHTQFWTPIPVLKLPAPFWLFLAGSVSSDILYCSGLVLSYRRMEMTTAYPMMRALPILLTALVTSLLGWGKPLSLQALAGFFVVFSGALLMPLSSFSEFRPGRYLNWNSLFILIVALGTTGYTVFDSRAQAVLTGLYPQFSPFVRSTTFYSTRGILLSSSLWLLVMLFPANRKALHSIREHGFSLTILAGLFASAAYVVVLLAMNFVTNVSYVQVFRQMGLPIGMLLGVLILKEHCPPVKCVGVTLILAGLALSVL